MGENPFFGIKKFYNLRTHVDKKTHAYSHVIETDLSYDADPIIFQFASDDTARPLRVIPVAHSSRRCKDCLRDEWINIVVPDDALRSHAATGYRVQVSSRLGDAAILTISPAMIAAQYEKLAAVIGPVQASAASAASTPAAPASLPEPATAATASAEAPAAKQAPPKPGVGLQMLPQSTSELTHGAMHGAVVLAVIPESPAAAAGIRGGDLIVKIDGHTVESAADVQDAIAKIGPHGVAKLDILRGPTALKLNLKR
jgi:hypothetical protein